MSKITREAKFINKLVDETIRGNTVWTESNPKKTLYKGWNLDFYLGDGNRSLETCGISILEDCLGLAQLEDAINNLSEFWKDMEA